MINFKVKVTNPQVAVLNSLRLNFPYRPEAFDQDSYQIKNDNGEIVTIPSESVVIIQGKTLLKG